jgi:hypothetical protein
MKREVRVLSLLGITACLLSLAACASGQSMLPEALGLAPVAPIKKNSAGWDVSHLKADDGSVEVLKEIMPEYERQKVKAEYRQTSLIELPIESRFNAKFFRIGLVDEYRDAIFVAPKVFAYGSSEKGRLSIKRNGNGTVSLSFPVLLTDGAVSTVQSPTADSTIQLPDTFQLQHIQELRATIASTYGPQTVLAPLPGCPKSISVIVANQQYDATPQDLAYGDYCQLNAPFTVTITTGEEEARGILEDALYNGAVDLRAVYETRVAFVTTQFKVSFNKAKVFRDISARLSVKTGWAEADVRAKVTEVVRDHAMKVKIVGDLNSHLDTVVSQAINLFFEKFNLDPDTRSEECGKALVCLRLNYNYSKESETFEFEWTQSTTTLTGQRYLTWTKLRANQDNVVQIGKTGTNCPYGTCRPFLANQGSESSIESGLTVIPGDLVEFTPEVLRMERRQLDVPVTVRKDNVVCVAEVPIFEEKCYRTCEFVDLKHWVNTLRSGLGQDIDSLGGRFCTRECDTVQTGTRCIRSENRWVETTRYSMGAVEIAEELDPVAYTSQLFEGLELKFTSSAGTAAVSCPLSSFVRHGDGRSMRVRIENRPGCQVFSDNNRDGIMLHLVNRIGFPQQYKAGVYIRDWTGAVRQEPQIRTYQPLVALSGKLGIRGYSFSSSGSGGVKMEFHGQSAR